MRALILAAGRGERLKPLTNKIPKCLVKIKDTPLLEIILKKIEKTKIKEIFINTYYLEDQVIKFLSGYKGSLKINILKENNLKGTGGTLVDNLNFFQGQDLLVLHADNFFLESLKTFLNAHEKRKKYMNLTLISFLTDDPKNCGICEVNSESAITNIIEKDKNQTNKVANGAIYFFSKKSLEQLKKMKNSKIKDIVLDILPNFYGKIFNYTSKKFFIDIGIKKNYFKALKIDEKINY
jgi:mannose-1-phosphate guanylyltransferase